MPPRRERSLAAMADSTSPFGSASTSTTRSPLFARLTAKLSAIVVLPQPPLGLAMPRTGAGAERASRFGACEGAGLLGTAATGARRGADIATASPSRASRATAAIVPEAELDIGRVDDSEGTAASLLCAPKS